MSGKTTNPQLSMSKAFWAPGPAEMDSYVLFSGTFHLQSDSELSLCHSGASFYRGYFCGEEIFEGPPRYALEFPEYQTEELFLEAGEHQIYIHAHHAGIDTHLLKATQPFIWCQLTGLSGLININWKCLQLESNKKAFLRTSPQFGWMEFRDTRLDPDGWEAVANDDANWADPAFGASSLPDPVAAKLKCLRFETIHFPVAACGPLATTFGYPDDDPAYTFFSRDRICSQLPATGFWFRFDLGKVRLGRPSVILDPPEGTVVEIAMAEFLTEGKVSPTINASLGRSCNMDRFVLRGGPQTVTPFTPRGGRFVEVHVLNVMEAKLMPKFNFIERGYYAESKSNFSCSDDLLQRIWMTGIETFRTCSEDALIDNPTRGRGQWTGDGASVGLEIGSIAFHDLRPMRRGLIQSAQCAREDGLVAGLSPGGCAYLPTCASQWVVAVNNYYRHTGDFSLLEELWPAAVRNMDAFLPHFTDNGLASIPGCSMVDWGHLPVSHDVDLTRNLHFAWSLHAMVQWGMQIGQDCARYASLRDQQNAILAELLNRIEEADGLNGIGFDSLVLASHLQLFELNRCLEFFKEYWLSCFPANPSGHRIADPQNSNVGLITPYLAHYFFPLLIESGDMDFVMDQYRNCWGWMLEDERTTWMEVFDTRWSHCHQWAGCPTWQLSRYVLGLFPRYDIGVGCFDFKLFPGSLSSAQGKIPHPCGGWIDISWKRSGNSFEYSLSVSQPVTLFLSNGRVMPVDQSVCFDPGLFCR